MAYCFKCGKPLNDGDKFCTHCGTEQNILRTTSTYNSKYLSDIKTEAHSCVINSQSNDMNARNKTSTKLHCSTNFDVQNIIRLLHIILVTSIGVLSIGLAIIVINFNFYRIDFEKERYSNSNRVCITAECRPMLSYFAMNHQRWVTSNRCNSFKGYKGYNEDSQEEYINALNLAKEEAANNLKEEMMENMVWYVSWLFICGILLYLLRFLPFLLNKITRKS